MADKSVRLDRVVLGLLNRVLSSEIRLGQTTRLVAVGVVWVLARRANRSAIMFDREGRTRDWMEYERDVGRVVSKIDPRGIGPRIQRLRDSFMFATDELYARYTDPTTGHEFFVWPKTGEVEDITAAAADLLARHGHGQHVAS